MNRLQGNVVAWETSGDLCLVEVEVAGARITSLVLESPETAGFAAGKPVTVLFKESEVSLAASPTAGISIRNRLPCVVTAVVEGKILSHVVLDYRGHRLHSLITTHALRELALAQGREVTALIKSTEVSLLEGHAGL